MEERNSYILQNSKSTIRPNLKFEIIMSESSCVVFYSTNLLVMTKAVQVVGAALVCFFLLVVFVSFSCDAVAGIC